MGYPGHIFIFSFNGNFTLFPGRNCFKGIEYQVKDQVVQLIKKQSRTTMDGALLKTIKLKQSRRRTTAAGAQVEIQAPGILPPKSKKKVHRMDGPNRKDLHNLRLLSESNPRAKWKWVVQTMKFRFGLWSAYMSS